MGLYDWFAAPLRCPACRAVSPPDGSTNAQTKLHPSPRQNYLEVGAALSVTVESADAAGYAALHPERPLADPVRILQTWECGSCGAYPQWLEVTVARGRIAAIKAVKLTHEHLAQADFIDGEDRAFLPEVPTPPNKPFLTRALSSGEVALEAEAAPGPGGAPFTLRLGAANPRDAVVAEVLAAAWTRGLDTLVEALDERAGHGEGEPLGYAYHDPRAEAPIPEGTVRLFAMDQERFLPERDFEALVLGLVHLHLEAAARLHISGGVEGALRAWLGRRG
jgi:hypothetical protein